MLEEGVEQNACTFITVLKACGNLMHLEEGKRLHSDARDRGLTSNVFALAPFVRAEEQQQRMGKTIVVWAAFRATHGLAKASLSVTLLDVSSDLGGLSSGFCTAQVLFSMLPPTLVASVLVCGGYLAIPFGRIAQFLKSGKYGERVGAGAPVYIAAVLEYLIAEVLELTGNPAWDNKKNRVVPCYIQLARRNDEDLSKLLGTLIIANGGVLPNIHSVLLPKKTASASKAIVEEE
ncbi:hypothetical protein L7F22_027689 [Adiantum nelumboides]|nr:hypothetical protein [Adiantum nelumboides]